MPTHRPRAIGFVAIVVLVAGLLMALWPGLVRAEPPNPANVSIQSYGPGSDLVLQWDALSATRIGVRYKVYSGWVETEAGNTPLSTIASFPNTLPTTTGLGTNAWTPQAGTAYTFVLGEFNGPFGSHYIARTSYLWLHAPVNGQPVTPTPSPTPTATPTPAPILAPEEFVLPPASLTTFETAAGDEAHQIARLYGACFTVFECLTDPGADTAVSLPTGEYTIEIQHAEMAYSDQVGEGAFLVARYITPPSDGFSFQVTGASLGLADDSDSYPESGNNTPTPIPAITHKLERPGRIETRLVRTAVDALEDTSKTWTSEYVIDYTASTSAPEERVTIFSLEARVQCTGCTATDLRHTPTPIPAVRPQVGAAHVTKLDEATLADARIRSAFTEQITWPFADALRQVARLLQHPGAGRTHRPGFRGRVLRPDDAHAPDTVSHDSWHRGGDPVRRPRDPCDRAGLDRGCAHLWPGRVRGDPGNQPRRHLTTQRGNDMTMFNGQTFSRDPDFRRPSGPSTPAKSDDEKESTSTPTGANSKSSQVDRTTNSNRDTQAGSPEDKKPNADDFKSRRQKLGKEYDDSWSDDRKQDWTRRVMQNISDESEANRSQYKRSSTSSADDDRPQSTRRSSDPVTADIQPDEETSSTSTPTDASSMSSQVDTTTNSNRDTQAESPEDSRQTPDDFKSARQKLGEEYDDSWSDDRKQDWTRRVMQNISDESDANRSQYKRSSTNSSGDDAPPKSTSRSSDPSMAHVQTDEETSSTSTPADSSSMSSQLDRTASSNGDTQAVSSKDTEPTPDDFVLQRQKLGEEYEDSWSDDQKQDWTRRVMQTISDEADANRPRYRRSSTSSSDDDDRPRSRRTSSDPFTAHVQADRQVRTQILEQIEADDPEAAAKLQEVFEDPAYRLPSKTDDAIRAWQMQYTLDSLPSDSDPEIARMIRLEAGKALWERVQHGRGAGESEAEYRAAVNDAFTAGLTSGVEQAGGLLNGRPSTRF